MLTSADWHIVGRSHGLSARNDDDGSAGGLRSFKRGSRLDGGGRAGRGEGCDGDSHCVFSWGAMSEVLLTTKQRKACAYLRLHEPQCR